MEESKGEGMDREVDYENGGVKGEGMDRQVDDESQQLFQNELRLVPGKAYLRVCLTEVGTMCVKKMRLNHPAPTKDMVPLPGQLTESALLRRICLILFGHCFGFVRVPGFCCFSLG